MFAPARTLGRLDARLQAASARSRGLGAAVAFAGFTCALTAQAEPPSSEVKRDAFAFAVSLSPEKSAPVHTLLLPVEVYRGLARPGFADVRVFNQAGVQVPHAVRILEPSASRLAASARLPIFPLRARPGAGDPRTAVTLSATRDADGTILDIHVATSTAQAAATAADGPIVAYLIDASSVTAPLDALRVALADGSAGELVLPVTIEVSDDLANFRAVGAPQTLVRLQYQGHEIEQDRLDLPDVRARYLRLSWGDQPAPVFEAVHADTGLDVTEPVALPLRTAGKWASSGDVAVYDLGAAMPLRSARLLLAEDNMLVRAALDGAQTSDGPYAPLFEGAFYRVRHGDALLESEAVAVAATVRYVRARVSRLGGAVGSVPPELELQREAEQLLYAERGPGPFELVFGHHSAASTAFSPSELLSMLPDAARSALPASDTSVGPVRELAGRSALQAPPAPPPVKKYVLWAVLVLAVVALGIVAVRLVRQER